MMCSKFMMSQSTAFHGVSSELSIASKELTSKPQVLTLLLSTSSMRPLNMAFNSLEILPEWISIVLMLARI